MDDSPVPVMAKSEDVLDAGKLNSKEAVKSLDPSPTRSSVKSVKSSAGSKTNRFGCNRVLAKAGSKSYTSLARNANQMDSSADPTIKTTSSTTNKSRSFSKIPSMRRTPLSHSITTVEKPAPEVKRDSQKNMSRNLQPGRKPVDLKAKQISRSDSKSSTTRSEPLQGKIMQFSTSKPNLSKSAAISNQLKTISKCQSARSSSLSTVSCKNRSASCISSRSTPCPTIETNLRKMMSTAGDFKKNDIEKDLSHDQNEKLPTKETGSLKTAESVDEFKSKIKISMDQWFSSFQNELKDTNNSNVSDIEQLKILKYNDILSLIDDWCATTRESGVEIFKQQTEESNKSIKNFEKKHNDLVVQYEKERLKLEKDLAEKAEADIVKKDEHIKEFQRKTKMQEKQINCLKSAVQNLEKDRDHMQADKDHLQEELKKFRECIATTNKKLHDCEQQLKQEKKELKSKCEILQRLENDLGDKNKLQTDLAEMAEKLEELQTQLDQKAHNECVEHMKQISQLSNQVSYLETDKQALQQINEKLGQEINDFEKVSEKLLEAENKLQELQVEFDKEKSLVTLPDNSTDAQVEIVKLSQSEAEKSRDIDKLKTELSKTQFNICQLEQQVQRDQQLLEVRSGLISSLQTNEKTHRIHIEELFAQVGEKNTTINELNSELQTKSEELRNIFNTLSAKQMEVANQEHIIKLLEESNERSQMLRVKQEEKIGRLEEELAHLKQTIAMYQANVLAGNSGRNVLYPPVLPSKNMDYNKNLYYYVSQRKRKRHVDINVRKYEA